MILVDVLAEFAFEIQSSLGTLVFRGEGAERSMSNFQMSLDLVVSLGLKPVFSEAAFINQVKPTVLSLQPYSSND